MMKFYKILSIPFVFLLLSFSCEDDADDTEDDINVPTSVLDELKSKTWEVESYIIVAQGKSLNVLNSNHGEFLETCGASVSEPGGGGSCEICESYQPNQMNITFTDSKSTSKLTYNVQQTSEGSCDETGVQNMGDFTKTYSYNYSLNEASKTLSADFGNPFGISAEEGEPELSFLIDYEIVSFQLDMITLSGNVIVDGYSMSVTLALK